MILRGRHLSQGLAGPDVADLHIELAQLGYAVPADEVPSETASVVEVNGKEIALVHTGGEFYALANECTHANYPIGEGDLVGENVIECPGHGSTFNVQTGDAMGGFLLAGSGPHQGHSGRRSGGRRG